MKTRSLVVAALLAVVMVVGSGMASAEVIKISFEQVSFNSPNIADQLYAEVSDQAGVAQIEIFNIGPEGSITNVYFGYGGDANPLEAPAIALIGVGNVSFVAGGAPASMPGSVDFPPIFYRASVAQNTADGIQAGESLKVQFDYAPGMDFGDLKSALYGDLVIGLHIRELGRDGEESDWYRSEPIPEPATMALLGLGIAGLALRRGKSMLRG